MQIDLTRFQATFFEEADEHLEEMEAALLQLEHAPNDSELLNRIFRGAHTIKGASGTFGFEGVGSFTHVLENLLDRLRDGELAADGELVGLLFTSLDVLNGLLKAAQNETSPPNNVDEILALLHEANGSSGETAAGEAVASADFQNGGEQTYHIEFHPSRDFFRYGQDPLMLLRDLDELGKISDATIDLSRMPQLSELPVEECHIGWSMQFLTEEPLSSIQDVFMFLDEDSRLEIKSSVPPLEAAPQPNATTTATENLKADKERRSGEERRAEPPAARTTPKETVRVDRDRLDTLINNIGELVIGTSMVEQDWLSVASQEPSAALTQMVKIVRDLQEMSLSLRMVPVSATFQKMARVVRDLTRKLGKDIAFEMSGEETELDKTVVDQIGDPLLHMIRNSVDHGIEMPDDRAAAGKTPQGRLQVRAYHQGGNIYIELEDDGKGLNLEAIRRKAVERGVIAEDDELTHQEVCDLVFHAGLSTAEKLSDVSGRGVGMDVVRRNIEALKGNVTVQTRPGQGTTVSVRLPLTLATLDGLTVKIGSEVYIIPLLSVVESFRPRPEDVKKLAGKFEVVHMRGEVIPMLRLHSVLNISGAELDPCRGLVVIVENHERKYALLVDELLGQQQVVIKNLESNFQKVNAVAGATILGDGRVALILDVDGLKSCAPKTPQPTSNSVRDSQSEESTSA
jgi:two-component system chemotaxis sensor kinase CheA